MLINDKLVFACGTGSSAPACQRSGRVYPKYFGKTTRQNAPPPAMTAIGEKFCTANTGIRADFAMARFKKPLFEPATTCAPAAAPPSPPIECKVVQYQCDYLHPCNIFTIRAISVLIPLCPFADRLVRALDYLTRQHGQK
jgi:hypothetical protein